MASDGTRERVGGLPGTGIVPVMIPGSVNASKWSKTSGTHTLLYRIVGLIMDLMKIGEVTTQPLRGVKGVIAKVTLVDLAG